MKAPQLFAAVCLLSVIGCATQYRPNGITGGYTETRLAPDLYRITPNGNHYTQGDQKLDFALLRASELCLQSGYPFFAVIDEKNTISSSSVATAGYSFSNGSAYGTPAGVGYSGSTTDIPGLTIQINKPEPGLMVKFLKTKPAGMMVFDAAFLLQSIKTKYSSLNFDSLPNQKPPFP